jgi:hypothetical protein
MVQLEIVLDPLSLLWHCFIGDGAIIYKRAV